MSKIKIKFAGGAGTATGSNFLLYVGDLVLMVDCGLYQGEKTAEDINREDFSYNPKDIDVLFVTHGHLDHVGRIPKLVKEGFEGTIVSTPATRDISEYVLKDSVNILANEADRDGLQPLFKTEDFEKAMSLWKVKEYYDPVKIDSGDKDIGEIKITFYNSGHILGSSLIVFEIKDKKIMFTGDLGNSPSPLLQDTENIQNVNYLITESVYGDRNHENSDYKINKLKSIILDVIRNKKTLLIPAFSVERTQELIYIFNNMIENKEIPLVPVFLDSPLGISITKVYKKYEKEFNENVDEVIKSGDDIFSFAGLTITKTKEESKQISNSLPPKIIIAGSGMSSGGRILYHEAKYLGDENTVLLLVGFQAAGTLGRKLQDGFKKVRIMGKEINVNARIEQISGFSAHKDSNNIQEYIGRMRNTLKEVFVVLGEPKSERFLAQRLIEKYHLKARVPELGEEIYLDI